MYWAGAAVQTRVTDKGEGGEAKRATRSGGKLSRAEQTTPGKQKEKLEQTGAQNFKNFQNMEKFQYY